MSSMEVDVPQMNGFNSHDQSRVAKKSVHFGSTSTRTAAAEVTIFNSSRGVEAKPKHKARRRARHPSQSEEMDNNPKPLSPIKLQKMTEKDRHSRTGVRGLPKKGNCLLCHVGGYVICCCCFFTWPGWLKNMWH